MKKLTILMALAALLSVYSCQNTNIEGGDASQAAFKATALISSPAASRVDYVVDNSAPSPEVVPTWTVGDEIFGFDSNGATFTFEVTAVDGSGLATLSTGTYAPAGDETLYAIYYPGKGVSDLSGTGSAQTLAVDLSGQNGELDADAPVLMCATATISAGAVSFDFENQTAIVGVKRFKLPTAAVTTVSSVTLNGVVTEGTISVVAGALALTPGSTPSAVAAAGSWTTDAEGVCETAVYFATLPTDDAHLVLNATDASSNEYTNVSAISQADIEAGYYYHMQKIFGQLVAEVNGEKYLTIDEAWTAANAATSPVSVTLLADCSPAAQLLLDNTGSGAVTLDLNGKTISTAHQIRVNNARELTVTDNSSAVLDEQGAITSTNASEKAVYIDASTFNLQGGTISSSATNVGESYPYALYSINATTLNLSGGKIVGNNFNALFVGTAATATVSGTKVNSKVQHGIYASGSLTITEGEVVAEGGYAAIYVTNTGSLTVSGGTFDSNAAPVITKAGSSNSAQVTGGLFSRQTEGDLFTVSSSGKCYVTGGYFDRPINSDRAKTSGGYDRPNKLNDNAATKDAYPYTVVSGTNYCNVTVDGNSSVYHHNAFASATKQANNAKANATIKAATNASNLGINDYTNIYGHTITLDINGKSLPTTNSAVITSAGKLIITDSGSTKGSISSNKTQVVYMVQAGADVTIDGCVITTSATTSTNAWDYAPINLNSASSKITIRNGAVISTAGSVTAISNRAGTLIIDDAVVTSGKTSTGLVAVYNGDSDATTTINGGSFYTSSANNTRPTVYNGITAAGTAGSVTINGGYFYSTLDRDVRCAWSADNAKLTINGGYFAHTTDWTVNPTYGPGKSLQLLDPADPAANHEHAGVVYTYNYIVTD